MSLSVDKIGSNHYATIIDSRECVLNCIDNSFNTISKNFLMDYRNILRSPFFLRIAQDRISILRTGVSRFQNVGLRLVKLNLIFERVSWRPQFNKVFTHLSFRACLSFASTDLIRDRLL